MRDLLTIYIVCPMLFVISICSIAQSNKSIKPFNVMNDAGWKELTLREKIRPIMLMLPDLKKELDLGNGSLEGFSKNILLQGFLSDGNYLMALRKQTIPTI